MQVDAFLSALERIEPPPCIGCPEWDYCAKYELACTPFYNYALNAKRQPGDDEPNRAVYQMTYETNPNRRHKKKPHQRRGGKRAEMSKLSIAPGAAPNNFSTEGG